MSGRAWNMPQQPDMCRWACRICGMEGLASRVEAIRYHFDTHHGRLA